MRAGDTGVTTPKLPLPALHWLATGGHAFLRAACDLGDGVQAGDTRVASPELDALCPHYPATGDTALATAACHPGWGHGDGTPRAGSLVPRCRPAGDAAVPQAELTAPAKVCATSPALLTARVVPAASPQAAIRGAMWGPRRPQPRDWGGWCVAAGLASPGSDCASHP